MIAGQMLPLVEEAAVVSSLDGEVQGHEVKMRLELDDRNKFLLVNRGFHRVQEYPFNR
jgi:hypothetical protein